MVAEFVNLTPHPVRLILPGGDLVVHPSGQPLRLNEEVVTEDEFDHLGLRIPVVQTRMTVGFLPPRQDGVVYIVSMPVAQAAAALGRDDFVAPDTGPASVVTGPDGRPVGVRRLRRFVS